MKLFRLGLWIAAGILVFVENGAAQSVFGRNLVVNGNAESSTTGWTRTGNPTVYQYADESPIGINDVGPFDRGSSYFYGGGDTAATKLAQDIDVSSGATAIDAGTSTFDASGYLGTLDSSSDTSRIVIAFLDAGGRTLASTTVGPFHNNDEHTAMTGLFYCREIGLVPALTRKVNVSLQFTGSGGGNEASADNIALTLTAARPASAVYGANLVINGGGEAGRGPADNERIAVEIPGWSRTGQFALEAYGLPSDPDAGFPLTTDPGPADRGKNMFAGGPSTERSTGYQDIDVSPAASQIDQSVVKFDLSAWLGGFAHQEDNAYLTCEFRRWDGTVVQTVTLSKASAADRHQANAFLHRTSNGTVPPGTRKIRVTLIMTREEGTYNDGYADSVSLILNAGGAPAIAAGGVITAGAFGGQTTIGPGTWIEIYGSNLSTAKDAREWAGTDFQGTQAPTAMDNVSVKVDGKSAFLRFISAGQVNVLVPDTVSAGQVALTITTANGTSAPYSIAVKALQPGVLAPPVFKVSGKQYVAAFHLDGSFVLPAGAVPGVAGSPAKPGETIVIYGIGFGPVNPSTPAGTIASQLANVVNPVQLQFGTASVAADYAGISPGYVGLYQLNVKVPFVADNDALPLTITAGGTPIAQTLYIAVQQ